MSELSPPGADTAAAGVRLDSTAEDGLRQDRARRYNVVTVPVLRLLALNAILVAVVLHHQLVGPAVSNSTIASFVVGVELYSLGSWILLAVLWDRLKPRSTAIRLSLLSVDIVACVLATYVTGGERSWLFFLAAFRLADAGIGFRAALVLGHVTPLLYVAMLWYVGNVDGRLVPFGPAAVNTFTLYITAMYFALIGRTATTLRENLVSAIRTSRDLIAQLDEKSERLAHSMERADEASRAKARLLATVSHELRTPLTAIIEHAELIMEDIDPANDAAIRADLAQVVLAARQLSGIVDDLLDVSSTDAGRAPLRVEQFDVAELVEEVAAAIEPLAARGGNAFSATVHGAPLTIQTDRARLRQILLILLGNSAKFSAGGKIALDVEPAGGEPRSHVFRVSDTGIGIPEEVRESLFTPFTQGDSSTTREYGGAGLGLVLAKRYADLLSAELSYETTAGVGTKFSLVVPLSPPPKRDV